MLARRPNFALLGRLWVEARKDVVGQGREWKLVWPLIAVAMAFERQEQVVKTLDLDWARQVVRRFLPRKAQLVRVAKGKEVGVLCDIYYRDDA